MTLMLYPNKHDPTGWRLQDKVLKVQMYFPTKQYGSLDKAEAAGRKEEAKLEKRRYFNSQRKELDINKLFYPDGSVIGLRVGSRKTKHGIMPILIAQVTVGNKQVSTSRLLLYRNFRDVYTAMQSWILDKRGITRTREISEMFKKTEHLYRI